MACFSILSTVIIKELKQIERISNQNNQELMITLVLIVYGTKRLAVYTYVLWHKPELLDWLFNRTVSLLFRIGTQYKKWNEHTNEIKSHKSKNIKSHSSLSPSILFEDQSQEWILVNKFSFRI